MSSISRVSLALAGGVIAVGLSAAPAFAAGQDTPSTGQNPNYSVVQANVDTAPSVVVKATKITRVTPKKVTVAKVVQPTGALAYTGSDAIVGGLAIGSALVLVGGVLVVGTRRRGTAA